MSKFKVGDKVRKTYVDEDNQYTIVKATFEDGQDIYTLGFDSGGRGNHWWHNDELELVTKGGDMKPYQRKTYRQLKETPNVKKGAIWQEACDDGTQEYDLISKEHDLDSRPGKTRSIWNRSLVEDNPAWFIEVFQVQPQYMTQAERDEWEAFKKTKTPAKRKVGRPSKK